MKLRPNIHGSTEALKIGREALPLLERQQHTRLSRNKPAQKGRQEGCQETRKDVGRDEFGASKRSFSCFNHDGY